MRYLLDTHTFLWFLLNNDSLSKTVRDIIEDSPILYLSIVSLWEIAIKTSIHKLNLKNRTNEILEEHSEIIGKIDIIGIEDFCKHYFSVH